MMKRRLIPVLVFLFSVVLVLVLFWGISKQRQVLDTRDLSSTSPVTAKNVQLIESPTSTLDQQIDRYLSQMTLEEKVGQLFWARVPYDQQIEDLQHYHLGGYLLFGRDMDGQTLESLRHKIQSYQEASRIPLLIGSDEEGGTVTRISRILETPFASPMSLYQTGGMEAVVRDTRSKSELLRSVGINAGLFPVADLATDPAAYIYPRTIGQDPQTTSDYIRQVVTVLNEEKLGSTLKHFPGYGNNGDSHTSLIYDHRTLDQLRASDFLTFQAGIKAGADSVLVSHNIMSQIDPVPASLSPRIHQILREELGFEGVIMTDDFGMAGLAQFTGQEEAAYLALSAGNDLVMGSSYRTQIPYVIEKVRSGQLSKERIDEAVRRVLRWKVKLGILNLDKEEP